MYRLYKKYNFLSKFWWKKLHIIKIFLKNMIHFQ